MPEELAVVLAPTVVPSKVAVIVSLAIYPDPLIENRTPYLTGSPAYRDSRSGDNGEVLAMQELLRTADKIDIIGSRGYRRYCK